MSRAQRIAFVSPRFPEGAAVGGAETLLKSLAARAAAAGRDVCFLTTCARNHFSWANEIEPGERKYGNLSVHFFPVDDNRDVSAFLRLQEIISRGGSLSADEELEWLRNSVNSAALTAFLRANEASFDRVVAGPYLFGLTYFTALALPGKTLLVPCLHDEPFARLSCFRAMFRNSAGFMFNSSPERDLARRLYDVEPDRCRIVGIGMEPFEADPGAFAASRGIESPYVLYCGRREPLKGTPLLLDYLDAFRSRTGKNVKIVLAGSGTIHPPAGLHGHIIDAGFLEEREKREAMAGAAVFCQPSVNESLSIVLLEAWLARTPAMVAAGSEVMRNQCARSGGGLWFRNYPEFEEELVMLLDNPRLRAEMAGRGRSFVLEEYSWGAIERKLLDALDQPSLTSA